MNLDKIKKAYFIGIGGIGVSAAAKFMLKNGKIVSGSDAADSEIIEELKKMGASILIGSDSNYIKKDIDLVIYSLAVPENNSERALAKKLGIKQISYPEFLGFLSRQMFTVAVSGTNGKSTTTAMLALILEKAGINPTVIVGSKVPSFKDGNLKLSSKFKVQSSKLKKDDFFVVEACEYKAAMLELSPKIILLTNIEEDHLDFYKNLEHIIRTFKKYIKKVENDGVVIYNMDDENSVEVMKGFSGRKISYGLGNKKLEIRNWKFGSSVQGKSADVEAKNVRIKNQRQIFEVYRGEEKNGAIKLKIPGIFNVYNAMAAIATSLNLGVNFKIIKKSLEEFNGIWRRFEIVGSYNGAVIISDYAHHPTAIKETIRAAKEFYPNRRIVAVFEPHSHNRTRKLFTEFSESFDDADFVILSEVYDVAGREKPSDRVSSRELAEAVRQCRRKVGGCCAQKGFTAPALGAGDNGAAADNAEDVFYAKDLKEARRILLKNIKKDDVVLIMGAGDIYKLSVGARGIAPVLAWFTN
ncbi:MAG: UDP-N-acetylmuramate--L-alanine ligase [bacterium]